VGLFYFYTNPQANPSFPAGSGYSQLTLTLFSVGVSWRWAPNQFQKITDEQEELIALLQFHITLLPYTSPYPLFTWRFARHISITSCAGGYFFWISDLFIFIYSACSQSFSVLRYGINGWTLVEFEPRRQIFQGKKELNEGFWAFRG
jgi:hypothetical protein